jgi:hypothetical protein
MITLEDIQTDIITETLVITTTVVPGPFAEFGKRQATFAPTNIPSYTFACSGSVKYSSACSSFGATQATITAIAPSITATVTTVRPIGRIAFLNRYDGVSGPFQRHS